MNSSNQQVAIVLKNYAPKSNRLALLDKELGRIEGIFVSGDISVSSLIRYQIVRGRGVYFLEGITIEDMPLSLARHDLLFIHHVIELCYYFIPVGSCVVGIFELLHFLYTVDCTMCSGQFKKLFVLKLLATIGLYPEVSGVCQEDVQSVLMCSVDMLIYKELDLASEALVNDWLLGCIAEHPKIECFKTIQFLGKNRTK